MPHARWVWEQHHGPIPEGYVVHHRDENPMNDDLENLELKKWGDHSRDHNLERGTPRLRVADAGSEAKCSGCGEWKPAAEYHRAPTTVGVQGYCRPCRRAYTREYYRRRRAMEREAKRC